MYANEEERSCLSSLNTAKANKSMILTLKAVTLSLCTLYKSTLGKTDP